MRLKYEFIRLSEEFKNNYNNIYLDDDGNRCIDLSEILDNNTSLKFPIGIFINGALLDSNLYEFKNKILTVKKDYPIYTASSSYEGDRIYMIMTSTSKENSGFIKQYICKEYAEHDENSIIVDAGGFKFANNKEIIGVIINGVLYGTETFDIQYDLDLGYTKINSKDEIVPAKKDMMTFLYEVNKGFSIRPDVGENDDLSILVIERKVI